MDKKWKNAEFFLKKKVGTSENIVNCVACVKERRRRIRKKRNIRKYNQIGSITPFTLINVRKVGHRFGELFTVSDITLKRRYYRA
jgi:hypothetical protein